MAVRAKDKADFLILGAGIAGMRAALELAPSGRVIVLTKDALSESNTEYAQGGIAAALADDDEVALHYQDTLRAGDGLCREAAVKALVEEGPQQIEQLMAWGMRFDRDGSKLAFGREGAHSRSRILHAHGDSTGSEILRALLTKAKTVKNVCLHPQALATDLLVIDGRVTGVRYLDRETRALRTIEAKAVLLATGGMGYVYAETTNPAVACGDGVAMAYRAGAQLSDLEFIQFHPTALYLKSAPRFLLSEALRGEGAILRDIMLERFMPRHHEAGELAPRDVVSRAIVMEMQQTRSEFAYLDMTHLDADRIQRRFPTIYATCLRYNLDITADLIPVRPAAHYAMGGVVTDLHGATTLTGLFAAGEVASTGVHGANRLASNSLLEGLVFGARAAKAMAGEQAPATARALPGNQKAEVCPKEPSLVSPPQDVVQEVRRMLWTKVGIIRNGKEMCEAVKRLESFNPKESAETDFTSLEAENILTVGRLIARSALGREESRGAHYRLDFPLKQEGNPPLHSYLSKESPVIFAP